MSSAAGQHVILLTPPGVGAIGVIRVVGPRSIDVVNMVFRPRRGNKLSSREPDCTRYGSLVDEKEDVVDDVVASIVEGSDPPAVDISAHGGIRVMERILELFDRRGAMVRRTEDGLSLVWSPASTVEREALEGLQRARTTRGVKFFARQRQTLPAALRRLGELCTVHQHQADAELGRLSGGYPQARMLIEGVTAAIVGPPNSGKSTLFNRLVGRTAALASPIAGTTRDWVSADVEMAGVPVTLFDTAGDWASSDGLEQEAQKLGRQAAGGADLVVLLLDGSRKLTDADVALVRRASDAPRWLLAAGKLDAGTAWGALDLLPALGTASCEALRVSALTGEGLEDLVRQMLRLLGFDGWDDGCPTLFTERQVRAGCKVLALLRTSSVEAGRAVRECLLGPTVEKPTQGWL